MHLFILTQFFLFIFYSRTLLSELQMVK